VTRPPRLLVPAGVPSTLKAFLLPYAEHYRARGWRVDAAANGARDDPRLAAAFDDVHDVPWTRRPYEPVNLTIAARRLRALVEAQRYDLVHVHDPVAAFVARFALRRVRARSGTKVVYTAHGFHFFNGNAPWRNAIYRTLEAVAARWTDHLIVINEEDHRAALRLPVAGDVTYMPGIGIDTARYDPSRIDDEAMRRVRRELGLSDDQQVLLMVAELNPGKRHRDAIAALAHSARDDVVLACAGVGPLEGELRLEAKRRGVSDRVVLLGFRNDIETLLRASFAMILPSEREGLPRCLMEASCMERPVIATRIRGVTELVEDGVTGRLVEVGDVDGLASAIRELAGAPETAEAMGRRGRSAMRRFDLAHVLRLHDAVYADLLTATSSGPPTTPPDPAPT
jgi:glycosyltransferase involved in cell wall biosynthesis